MRNRKTRREMPAKNNPPPSICRGGLEAQASVISAPFFRARVEFQQKKPEKRAVSSPPLSLLCGLVWRSILGSTEILFYYSSTLESYLGSTSKSSCRSVSDLFSVASIRLFHSHTLMYVWSVGHFVSVVRTVHFESILHYRLQSVELCKTIYEKVHLRAERLVLGLSDFVNLWAPFHKHAVTES